MAYTQSIHWSHKSSIYGSLAPKIESQMKYVEEQAHNIFAGENTTPLDIPRKGSYACFVS